MEIDVGTTALNNIRDLEEEEAWLERWKNAFPGRGHFYGGISSLRILFFEVLKP